MNTEEKLELMNAFDFEQVEPSSDSSGSTSCSNLGIADEVSNTSDEQLTSISSDQSISQELRQQLNSLAVASFCLAVGLTLLYILIKPRTRNKKQQRRRQKRQESEKAKLPNAQPNKLDSVEDGTSLNLTHDNNDSEIDQDTKRLLEMPWSLPDAPESECYIYYTYDDEELDKEYNDQSDSDESGNEYIPNRQSTPDMDHRLDYLDQVAQLSKGNTLLEDEMEIEMISEQAAFPSTFSYTGNVETSVEKRQVSVKLENGDEYIQNQIIIKDEVSEPREGNDKLVDENGLVPGPIPYERKIAKYL